MSLDDRMPTLGPAMGLALVAALAALALAPAVRATDGRPEPLPVTLGSGSTVSLAGTSTLHDFESRTSEMAIHFQREPGAKDPVDAVGLDRLIRSAAVTGLDVDIPVASLRSGKGGLDKNLQKTLNAARFPAIHFHMEHYTLAGDADTSDMQATGTLTVAGHDRATSLAARTWRSGGGVWIEGVQPLLMSDFEIKAPVMMLGALKVGDRVIVHYRLLLVPDAGGQASRNN